MLALGNEGGSVGTMPLRSQENQDRNRADVEGEVTSPCYIKKKIIDDMP